MGRKTIYQTAYDDEFRRSDAYGCVAFVCEENARAAAEKAVQLHNESVKKNAVEYVRKYRKKRASTKNLMQHEGRQPITIYLSDAGLKSLDAKIRDVLKKTPDEISRSHYIDLLLSL
jgi:hypothetical protein